MTPTRLREILDMMGETQRGFAHRVGWPERLVRYWASGKAPIPAQVESWLEAWVTWWQAQPQNLAADGSEKPDPTPTQPTLFYRL